MSHSDIALNTRNRNGAAQTLVSSCCGKQKAHLDRLPQAGRKNEFVDYSFYSKQGNVDSAIIT